MEMMTTNKSLTIRVRFQVPIELMQSLSMSCQVEGCCWPCGATYSDALSLNLSKGTG